MDSSNQIDIKKANLDIIESLKIKKAYNADNAVFVEELHLEYPIKVIYYLVEEFVRSNFITVLEDGRIYFNQKKYEFEKKKTQGIYIGILLIPFIIGILMLIM